MFTRPTSLSDNSTNSVLTYFKDHLLVSGLRGGIYQISYFTYFCLHQLFKERAFQAKMESRESGNLDDIQLIQKDKIKAYQVKFFQEPISLQEFWNKKGNQSKHAPMHIGKFFDGWLSLNASSQQKEVIPYLLTNTSLGEDFLEILKLNPDKDKKQFRFKKKFIREELLNIKYKCPAITLCKVKKNFLEEKGASNPLSSKIWNILEKGGIFDEKGFPTEKIVNERDSYWGLEKNQFEDLTKAINRAHGKLTLENVAQKLDKIKENYLDCKQSPIGDVPIFELLFLQSCAYLRQKKRHSIFLAQDRREQKEEFKKFLNAFRINVERDKIEQLQDRTQELLVKKYPSFPLLYSQILFAIESWFILPRPFIKKQGEETPLITNISMQEIIDKAEQEIIDKTDIYSRGFEKLCNYSYRQLEHVQTSIDGLTIQRTTLLDQIDQKLSPGSILVITGPKGIGKSALVKLYLTKQCCPWFAFRGQDLSEHTSLEAFLTQHGLSIDEHMFKHFDTSDKKIIYIDSIEEITRKDGAFLVLINLFKQKHWTICLSSNGNSMDWIKENITNEISILNVSLLGNEVEKIKHSSIVSFIQKYPILGSIYREYLFQPYYNALFETPLYLKFFCEEMRKLASPETHFTSYEVLHHFERKIWKKVVRKEDSVKSHIAEARQSLMVEMTIDQLLGRSIKKIFNSSNETRIIALSTLKDDQLLNNNGEVANDAFIDLSLNMYFQDMIKPWLVGQELDNVSDDKLGGVKDFELKFNRFLYQWFHLGNEIDLHSDLLAFLEKEYARYEGFCACLFHFLLHRKGVQAEVTNMLEKIPNLANLPLFFDGDRVEFPINKAIDRCDTTLIELLLDYGAKISSSPERPTIIAQQGQRPKELGNIKYKEVDYMCLIPLRGAVASCIHIKEPVKKREFLNFLVGKGAKIQDPADSYHIDFGYSLLYVAIENNDLETVSFLLDQGAPFETCYYQMNKTPLGLILQNFLSYAQEATEKMALGEISTASECLNLMHNACKIFQLLISKGAKKTSRFAEDALTTLVQERQYALAQFLIKKGFDPMAEDKNGWNTFIYAMNNYQEHKKEEDKNFALWLRDQYPSLWEQNQQLIQRL